MRRDDREGDEQDSWMHDPPPAPPARPAEPSAADARRVESYLAALDLARRVERELQAAQPRRPAVSALPVRPWIPAATDTRVMQAIAIAQGCVGYQEDPPGSNRGAEIDAICRRAGIPIASYWCAAWAGQVWLDAQLAVPPGYPSCQTLMLWAQATGRWSTHVPSLGALVLYGDLVARHAHHVGLIIRVAPLVETLEGNTTVECSRFERNGTAVATKLVVTNDPIPARNDPVLGYCHPFPLTAPVTGAAA